MTLEGIEGRKQRGRAVALVIMSHRAAAALFHRQARVSPVQSLNLTLLVRAQNDGVLGWIQVQPDDVGGLGRKLCGSVLMHQLRRRCKWMPWARNTRQT